MAKWRESTMLAFVYLKNGNESCPVCLCVPCDCDGVSDEYRGVGETTVHRSGDHSLRASQIDRVQSSSDNSLEREKQHTKDMVFSKGLYKDS